MPCHIPRPPRWRVATDSGAWLEQARTYVLQAAARALAERGVFHIVLAGGNTPERLYRALAESHQDWARWEIWFGDERCLPADDPERNSVMAARAWLDRVALPPSQRHVIPAERGPAAAAQDYAQALSGLEAFDLVLLGLGQDGHTASLFPGRDWGEAASAPPALAVEGAPKPPSARVSLSANRLARARQVLFLVAGADKQNALRQWRQGAHLPAAAICPAAGVDVLMDPAAAATHNSDHPGHGPVRTHSK